MTNIEALDIMNIYVNSICDATIRSALEIGRDKIEEEIKEPEWIPCTKRMPKRHIISYSNNPQDPAEYYESDVVLVLNRDGKIGTAKFTTDTQETDSNEDCWESGDEIEGTYNLYEASSSGDWDIVAWKPLRSDEKEQKHDEIRSVYLASPFFNEAELTYVKEAEDILSEKGLYVHSPRKFEVRDGEVGTPYWSKRTFENDTVAIRACDAVVMLYHDNYSDSGTAWECGYAYALDKPVIVVHLGENSNLMVHEGSYSNLMGLDALREYDFKVLPKMTYTGSMF